MITSLLGFYNEMFCAKDLPFKKKRQNFGE